MIASLIVVSISSPLLLIFREKLSEEVAVLREQVQLMQANFAQSQINLKVAATQQKALEANIIELTGEKRILIKEFKATKAMLDKSRKVNKKVLGAYDSLEKKYRSISKSQTDDEDGESMGSGDDHLRALSPSDSLSIDLKIAIEVR